MREYLNLLCSILYKTYNKEMFVITGFKGYITPKEAFNFSEPRYFINSRQPIFSLLLCSPLTINTVLPFIREILSNLQIKKGSFIHRAHLCQGYNLKIQDT